MHWKLIHTDLKNSVQETPKVNIAIFSSEFDTLLATSKYYMNHQTKPKYLLNVKDFIMARVWKYY